MRIFGKFSYDQNGAFRALGVALFAFLVGSSGCVEDTNLPDGLKCDSTAYADLKAQHLKELQWGGMVPTKELVAAFSNRSDSVALDPKDLDTLSDGKEYEVTLTGQDAGRSIRSTDGRLPDCYSHPACLRANNTLQGETTVCADAATGPFSLYVRSVENYSCEGLTLTSSTNDWATKNSSNCATVPANKSITGVFRFRITGSPFPAFTGNPSLWFSDDDGRGYSVSAGLKP